MFATLLPTRLTVASATLTEPRPSGSVQTQVFGVSSGGTVRDMNCERLKLSKTLYDMGMKVAAVAVMCQDERVFNAMMNAGTDNRTYEIPWGLKAANRSERDLRRHRSNDHDLLSSPTVAL